MIHIFGTYVRTTEVKQSFQSPQMNLAAGEVPGYILLFSNKMWGVFTLNFTYFPNSGITPVPLFLSTHFP